MLTSLFVIIIMITTGTATTVAAPRRLEMEQHKGSFADGECSKSVKSYSEMANLAATERIELSTSGCVGA